MWPFKPKPRLVSVGEAAALASCDVATISAEIAEGRLPALVDRDAVESWATTKRARFVRRRGRFRRRAQRKA